MPIKDLSDSVRLPRLGKIHLGTRHPEKGYPQKADHFVFPKDHSDYDKLVELYTKTPKELPILIPVEDEEIWASQYYRCYSQTYGLLCKGDGETAMQMVSAGTGELPDPKKPGTVTMKEIPCNGRECPIYQNKEKGKPQCHEVMNLRFILPEVPGLGVWQIDTGSKNSILNINACAKIIKRAFGRISMIPLKLTFELAPVGKDEQGKQRSAYVLMLRSSVTLAQLASAAREQAKTFLLEGPDLESVLEVEVEKDIEELWGEGKPVDTSIGEITEKKPTKSRGVKPESSSKPLAEPEAPPLPGKETQTEQSEKEPMIDKKQVDRIKELMEQTGYSTDDIKAHVAFKWGKAHSADLTHAEAAELIQDIGDFKIEKTEKE